MFGGGSFVAKRAKTRFWVQNYLFCTVRLAKPLAGKGFVSEAGAKVGEFCNLRAFW